MVDRATWCSDTVVKWIPASSVDSLAIEARGTCIFSEGDIYLYGSYFYDSLSAVKWYVDGLLVTTLDTMSYYFENPAYEIEAEIWTKNGCFSETRRVLLPDSASPVEIVIGELGNGTYSFSLDSPDTVTGAIWNFGNGETINSPDPVYTFEGQGEFEVSVTATYANSCKTTASTSYFPTGSLPSAAISHVEHLSNGGLTDFNVVIVNTGQVTIRSLVLHLSRFSGEDLYYTLNEEIPVGGTPVLKVPNQFKVKPDDIYCFEITEVNQVQNPAVAQHCIPISGSSTVSDFFPNPTTGNTSFYCFGDNSEMAPTVFLMDIGGRPLREIPFVMHAGKCTLDISSIPKGIYLVKIFTDEDVFIKKLIRQ